MNTSFKTLLIYASLATSMLMLSGCQNNADEPTPSKPSNNTYPESTYTSIVGDASLSPPATTTSSTTASTTSGTLISAGESTVITDTSTSESTASADSSNSTTSEPEEKEMTAADVLESLSKKLGDVTSFNLSGTVKGTLPVEVGSNRGKVDIESKMLRHTFTYAVSQKNEHFTAQTENLNDATFESKYEEYRHLDDEIITTYTLSNNTWVDSTPKELSRKNLAQALADDFGLIRLFKNPAAFQNPELKLLDNGYQINTKWADLSLTEAEMKALLNKLIRCDNLKIRLDSINPLTSDQMLTVTMDEDFNLTGISCDIITDNCDIRVNLLITDYGKPLNITMPNE